MDVGGQRQGLDGLQRVADEARASLGIERAVAGEHDLVAAEEVQSAADGRSRAAHGRVANTPEAIYALGVEGLSEYIKTIGLYNSKARNVIETCRILIERHESQVPDNREALEALPGVGRKTANVVLNTAFRQPTMAVDTHIFRVSNRTGIAPGKNVLEVEKKLLKFVPKEFLLDAHHWLILHGRYVCVARKPRCGACKIEDLCEYKAKTSDD